MTKKLRSRPLGEPLKQHPTYVAAREAKLAQLAVETPDCTFQECQDCCYLERLVISCVYIRCPECDGWLRNFHIIGGRVDA